MTDLYKTSLWNQFGASITMVENAINACSDEHWNTHKRFFYMTYHVLMFLDYYLQMPAGRMSTRLPFTFISKANRPAETLDNIVPDKHYTKSELLDFLKASREKCHHLIMNLTEESAKENWVELDDDRVYPFFELLLYNMRHVQHHAAQLNLLLSQSNEKVPGWVSRAK